MRTQLAANNRGIALLITLSVISVLLAAAFEINRRSRSELAATAVMRDRLTLAHTASAGIHIAMAMLVKDRQETNADSIQEDWADPDKISEVLAEVPVDEGKLTLIISDELSRIQINALVDFPDGLNFNEYQHQFLARALTLYTSHDENLEEIEIPTVLNSLKDWLDSKDDDMITGVSGAESDYYEDLDPPYFCRNGPVPLIAELARVQGMAPELFYGVGEKPGLSAFLTEFGQEKNSEGKFTYPGKVNINTAELPVLAALLPTGSEDLAQSIYDFRQEKTEDTYAHALTSQTWYKDAPGCGDLTISPELITISSDLFRISATAAFSDTSQTVTAWVKREKESKSGKWTCRVLRWLTD